MDKGPVRDDYDRHIIAKIHEYSTLLCRNNNNNNNNNNNKLILTDFGSNGTVNASQLNGQILLKKN